VTATSAGSADAGFLAGLRAGFFAGAAFFAPLLELSADVGYIKFVTGLIGRVTS